MTVTFILLFLAFIQQGDCHIPIRSHTGERKKASGLLWNQSHRRALILEATKMDLEGEGAAPYRWGRS